MGNSGGSRWWETYLVRYITGSVVGAVIVYVLLVRIDSNFDLIPCWGEVKSTNLLVLGALGFAYCYLASAPVALLHSVRAMYGPQDKSEVKNSHPQSLNYCRCCRFFESINKADWLFIGVLLVAAVIAAGLGLATYPTLWGISAVSGMTLTFFYALALRLYFKTDDKEEWQRWYLNLAYSRDSNSRGRKEFIESYRHLREHGNAFFIVVLELLLGVILFSVATLIANENITSETKAALISLMVFILIYWAMAGALCWLLANKLENYMVGKNSQFRD